MPKFNIPMMATIIIGTIAIILATTWIIKLQEQEQQDLQSQRLEGIDIYYPKSEVSALLFDGKYIWVGGRDGLFLIDPQNGELIRDIATDIQMIYTAGICQTFDGTVWVGYENGIAVFDGDERLDFIAPDIPSGRVNTVLCDEDGGVWAGMQAGAVHFIKENNRYIIESILTTNNGLRENVVNTMSIDGTHGIWFGAYLANKQGGLSILRKSQWQYISTEEGLPHRYVTSIIPVSKTHMLIGVGHLERGGMALVSYHNEQATIEATYSTDNGLPGEKIRQLYLDSYGHIWITSESDGLLIIKSFGTLLDDHLAGVYLSTNSGLSDNEIKTIVEVEGAYWLGGRYGVTRIEQGTIENELMSVGKE